MAAYVPDRGEVVWLNFSPQAGYEQAGRRPAVVLSPRSYNQPTGLAILCPITNRAKGYPCTPSRNRARNRRGAGGPDPQPRLAGTPGETDWPA